MFKQHQKSWRTILECCMKEENGVFFNIFSMQKTSSNCLHAPRSQWVSLIHRSRSKCRADIHHKVSHEFQFQFSNFCENLQASVRKTRMWNIRRPNMHVHVISVTFFWSRGTSFANSLLSAANMSSPRFAWLREGFERGSCINFRQQPLRTNKSQGTRIFSESFVTFVQWHLRTIVPH